MTAYPSITFILLHSFTGNIFGTDIFRTTSPVIICLHMDSLTFGCFHFQIGCKLTIVRQTTKQSIALCRLPDIWICFQTKIFKHRYRTFHQFTQWGLPHYTCNFCTWEASVKIRLVPTIHCYPGIKTDITFRQAIIRERSFRILISIINGTCPTLIRNNLYSGCNGFKQQSCHSAIDMAETIFSKMPHQNSKSVLS